MMKIEKGFEKFIFIFVVFFLFIIFWKQAFMKLFLCRRKFSTRKKFQKFNGMITLVLFRIF